MTLNDINRYFSRGTVKCLIINNGKSKYDNKRRLEAGYTKDDIYMLNSTSLLAQHSAVLSPKKTRESKMSVE